LREISEETRRWTQRNGEVKEERGGQCIAVASEKKSTTTTVTMYYLYRFFPPFLEHIQTAP